MLQFIRILSGYFNQPTDIQYSTVDFRHSPDFVFKAYMQEVTLPEI